MAGMFSVGLLDAQISNLVVGINSSGNFKDFSSGTNTFSNTYIGLNADAFNNLLTIANTDTRVSNISDVYIGYSGSSNKIIIGNSATFDNGGSLVVGYEASSRNNSLNVLGDSILNVAGNLSVGWSGSGNSMFIQGGSQVTSASGNISSGAGASNNSVLVDGTGSLWKMNGDLTIGGSGEGTLNVINGGMVSAASIRIINGTVNVATTNGLSNSAVSLGGGS